MMRRLDAQLGTDGSIEELPEATERMRLFEPAPEQLQGQEALDIDDTKGIDHD